MYFYAIQNEYKYADVEFFTKVAKLLIGCNSICLFTFDLNFYFSLINEIRITFNFLMDNVTYWKNLLCITIVTTSV